VHALPAAVAASVGLATMGPLVGMALIELFTISDHPWIVWAYDRTILAPLLAATWRSTPLAILICWAAFGGLSRMAADAAELDGAGPARRFYHVAAVPRLPALVVAWLVALAIACGELSASILVVPPGVTTVPIRVFGLMHAGVRNQVSAICLTNVILFLLITTLVMTIGRFALRGMAQRPAW
jgi:iron(III) transport system permease protein